MAVIIVTGAQGFLGSVICQYFRSRGQEVLGLSRTPSETSDGSFQVTDYSPKSLRVLFSARKPQAVIHAAGGSSVPASVADPQADFVAGPALTGVLLEALQQAAPSTPFLFLSSAAVYGNPDFLPVRESAVRRPLSPYGQHKAACEDLCAQYVQLHSIPCAVARIFSAYGPGLKKQVLWDLSQKLVKSNDRLILQGTGLESRDFIHCHDVAVALDCILMGGTFDGSAYNLASGSETTIRSLAEQLGELTPTAPALEFDGVVPAGNPLRWQADISRLRQLGFSPTISLTEGLREYFTWFHQISLS